MNRLLKHNSLKTAGLLFLISLSLFIPSAMAQRPNFDRRFGVVNSFVNTEEANAAGVGWTRIFLRWDVIQPGGSSDWKPSNVPDPFINAEVEAGREIAAVLIGSPGWATEAGNSRAVPPMHLWGNFVFKTATQYKGRINHWIIWHQPDVTDPASSNHTWDGSVEEYYYLLREAYLKIKAVDPNMKVGMAGLNCKEPDSLRYLSRLLDIAAADQQAGGDNYYFDFVGCHLYYDPRLMIDVLANVRQVLTEHGMGQKPIWINETNAPPSSDYLEPLEVPALFKITLEEQSSYIIQAYAMALAGGAERVSFNKMRNERVHPESVEPYGLLRGDNSRRPAFYAFKTVTTHFANTQNATLWQQGNIYVVTLDRGGQTTTVLWNTATIPTKFSINAIAAEATLVDEQDNQKLIQAVNGGYEIELPAAVCANGANCFIGGAPRLLVEAGSPTQRVAISANPPTPTVTPLPSPSPTETTTAQSPPTLTPTPTLVGTAIAGAEYQPANPVRKTPSPVFPAVEQPPVVSTPPTSAATPSITLSSFITPGRVLWLFLIGLIVFTVSYGLQVVVWYKWFKR